MAHGFVDNVIERNRIDVRGGKSAAVVLAGNHWNLRFQNNHLLGGGESLLIQSTPTENPFIWGWSHTPFLDFVCEDNRHEDSRHGVALDVYSNRHNKTTAGRLYLSGIYRSNTILGNLPEPPEPAIKIGSHSAEEVVQMHLRVDGNRGPQSGQPLLLIRHATINGQTVREQTVPSPFTLQPK